MAGSNVVAGDTAQAITFLKSICGPGGLWLLSAIDPLKTGVIETKTFSADAESAAVAWINFWQGKRNIYYSANQPRGPMTVKAEKKDIGTVGVLHVDVDPVAPPEGMDTDESAVWYETQQEAIYQKVMAYVPTPSVVVFSGGGYQAYWLLREGVEVDGPETVARLEAYNRRLEKDLGGDHCFNVDRIMRLPGTMNMPSKKKQAKGRRPAQAAVAHANYQLEYGLGDFEPWVAPTDKKRSTGGGAIPRREPPDWCLRVISQGPDPEGPKSYGGDRSKAVWAVCCTLVRSGYTDEEIVAVLLDKANKISEHVHAQPKPLLYAPRQAARAREKVGDDFTRNDKGRPIGSQGNLRLALSLLEVTLSYNAFRSQHMIEGPDGKKRRPMSDDDLVALYLRMDDEFSLRVGRDLFWDVMKNEAWRSQYHPVKTYLDSLQWDGVSRIDSWLTTYLGAPHTRYTKAVGRISLLAAIRRIKQPGVKFDEMLVLISPQGTGKSNAIACLAVAEEWFTDSLPLNADDKQVIEALAGKWIVEAAELKGMKTGNVEHLKAFLSRQYDRARLAWGRMPVEMPRQCVFMGTTNSDAFLRDVTGNRRFWPVAVNEIDMAGLKRDRDQLWAEAVQREAAGESIRLDPELWGEAALEQSRRAIDDPWLAEFENLLRDFDTGKIVASDLWNALDIPKGMRNQDHNMRLGEVMRTLGWVRGKLSSAGHPAWHYAKGTVDDRKTGLVRIRIVRSQQDGSVLAFYEGEGPVDVGTQDQGWAQ